jgi:Arc/MetJ-type ribon-helix-helix transcriptional regulator
VKTSQSKEKNRDIKRHMTVRIPRGITEAIEDFLTTEQAAQRGFDSKADVVTTAVRSLLTEYGYYSTKKHQDQSRISEKQKEAINR